jgi:transposase
MVKNHRLAESISECSWFEFVRRLEYKGRWYGRTVVKIDRFFPSSKTCSNCGFIKESLNLSERRWTCPKCNTELDRDLNAANNILKQGLNSLSFGTNEYSRGDEVNLKSTKSGRKYCLRSDEKEEKRISSDSPKQRGLQPRGSSQSVFFLL